MMTGIELVNALIEIDERIILKETDDNTILLSFEYGEGQPHEFRTHGDYEHVLKAAKVMDETIKGRRIHSD